MKYAIEIECMCGWDQWSHIEDENGDRLPDLYDTQEAAQAEIDDFFGDIEDQIRSGERQPDEGYDRDGFRIVEVKDAT
tara:strand:+ start:1657 stop:1890 length:234 start_codon:yes stop_codon:yes gene_type:complete